MYAKYDTRSHRSYQGWQFLPSIPSPQKNPLRSLPLSRNYKSTKSPSRTPKRYEEPKETNVVKMGNRNYRHVELIPRNTAQEAYVEALYEKRMVFAVGPAGTGKTLLAVLRAIQALRDGDVTKIVLTRPAVSVDEDIGFLPGDLNAKMAPWTRPLFDVFEEYYGLVETKAMLEEGVIAIEPLGFMRGRTFKHSYIVLDEAQNTTIDQMKMVLTRLGTGSSLVVTGDLRQHDRGYETNGLSDFLDRLNITPTSSMAVCKFERKHVERDPLVAEVLKLYGED